MPRYSILISVSCHGTLFYAEYYRRYSVLYTYFGRRLLFYAIKFTLVIGDSATCEERIAWLQSYQAAMSFDLAKHSGFDVRGCGVGNFL